jgi:Na+-translocating ferredoxin:NAD+ oxidoreductase subunit C
MRTLHSFSGGIHPAEHKAESTGVPITPMPLLPRYVVPLSQHIGEPAESCVKTGDRVLRGQMIGRPVGTISTAVHAPTSGIVSAVEMHPVAHPSGLSGLCVVIESDGDDQALAMAGIDWRQLDPAEVRTQVRDLGLAGLGGAVFPSAVKLDRGWHAGIPTLILNGSECEPWITCDDMLMRERAADILRGAAIMRHLLGALTVLIGIEDNKPEAIAAMTQAAHAAGFPVEVITVPTRYPSGGAKQLTRLLTGLDNPSGKLATEIGVQVFNVGTAYSLYRALELGEPMLSRLVTVTGHVSRPGNYEARLGTPIRALLDAAGGELPDTTGHIIGGPMMGFDLDDARAPVVKAVNCIIATSARLFPPLPPAMPCIRCGLCAQACPADLLPFELYWYSKAKDFDKTKRYKLFDCIECGCCSFVCPSHIPLVDYYRFAKSEIRARDLDAKASQLARERHDFRSFRLEREKREKAEKLAQKATSRLDSGAVAADDPDAAKKKAILQAAIERAAKAKAAAAPLNTDNPSPAVQHEIDAIEARRQALQGEPAAQPKSPTEAP